MKKWTKLNELKSSLDFGSKTRIPPRNLEYNSPFELLIAVILSAQATDKGVNKATAKLFPIANTPQAILDLGLEGLKEYIKTIGLYNSKAENIIKTCRDLVEKHNGEVPESREALEALAGVGRKTANVVLNTAFGHPTYCSGYPYFSRMQPQRIFAPGKDGGKSGRKKLLKVVPKRI